MGPETAQLPKQPRRPSVNSLAMRASKQDRVADNLEKLSQSLPVMQVSSVSQQKSLKNKHLKTTQMKMIWSEVVPTVSPPAPTGRRILLPSFGVKHEAAFRLVWFEAWKYAQEEALWAALVLEILRQIRTQMSLPRQLLFSGHL